MNCCGASIYSGDCSAVRYSYIDIAPLAETLSVDIASLNTDYGVVWHSHDVTLSIRKRGCKKSCEKENLLQYEATEISDSTVTFTLDKEFWQLCRGRYEGIISIGCDELNCRLDFHRGQYLCADNISSAAKKDDVDNVVLDALEISDPNCCKDSCEEKRHSGCFDAFSRGGCGGDDCDIESIPVEVEISAEMDEEINQYIAGETPATGGEVDIEEYAINVSLSVQQEGGQCNKPSLSIDVDLTEPIEKEIQEHIDSVESLPSNDGYGQELPSHSICAGVTKDMAADMDRYIESQKEEEEG